MGVFRESESGKNEEAKCPLFNPEHSPLLRGSQSGTVGGTLRGSSQCIGENVVEAFRVLQGRLRPFSAEGGHRPGVYAG